MPDWENYRKGTFTQAQESALWNKRLEAVANMESKKENSKNYSSVFTFIKTMEEVRKDK